MPAEHFAAAPGWEWWILGYFFFAGIAGGSYALGTMLRLWGTPRDEPAARIAFLVSFPALLVCPILLTADLGQPFRFWHMLFDTSNGGLAFKFWSPMSLGSWALMVFGLFSFVSFVAALAEGRQVRLGLTNAIARVLSGTLGRLWNVIGMAFGLFVAGYTGVLLSVSNQPVWSDGWPLAGLFLASALSGSAALLLLLTRTRAPADTETALADADRSFAFLELALIAIFVVAVGLSGFLTRMLGPWLLLWLLVAIGIGASLIPGRAGTRPRLMGIAAVLALVGVVALRALVIFSAQL
jgi:formate-dependent nitrite reductase membrane component NrfD